MDGPFNWSGLENLISQLFGMWYLISLKTRFPKFVLMWTVGVMIKKFRPIDYCWLMTDDWWLINDDDWWLMILLFADDDAGDDDDEQMIRWADEHMNSRGP